MTYCKLADVKKILQITESTWDTQINSCIPSADGLVDSFLAIHDLTVPSPTPQNIVDASAHYAAWLYRKRQDPAGTDAFKTEAEVFLNMYLNSVVEVPAKIGEMDLT